MILLTVYDETYALGRMLSFLHCCSASRLEIWNWELSALCLAGPDRKANLSDSDRVQNENIKARVRARSHSEIHLGRIKIPSPSSFVFARKECNTETLCVARLLCSVSGHAVPSRCWLAWLSKRTLVGKCTSHQNVTLISVCHSRHN